MFPRVTHRAMLVAFASRAHAVTASTRSVPTPRPRTCGATHIETRSTIGEDGSSRYPPARPTSSSSSCAKKVARSFPREPATARWAHSASVRFASDRYVDPNVDGASSRAASRTCFRRAPSRVVMRRTSTRTASSERARYRNWITGTCHQPPAGWRAGLVGDPGVRSSFRTMSWCVDSSW